MDKEDQEVKEGENMSAIAKEESYKKLSLTPKKLQEITVRPATIKDGKLLFDKNDKDHRYIVEGE
ncbi:Nuclease subunit of the excinuclease complex [Desulfosporosinus sp. I2]|uniref:hypothetical protein n=1 Tax=Desulfosporosinus sp. I2 TaxID=1617025 RepID=UPI0005EFBEEA|nr:hypothetical protein [Desulfosporosinus sp. I2]KJR45552.1 Nuclease subunit of the excinuclease complex [Desulfosporosinus sp. I2]